jgi:hypothetical protein
MLESIGKGNSCIIVVVCMAKINNQQDYKTSTHQNRKKHETIVEEIRLQLTQVM